MGVMFEVKKVIIIVDMDMRGMAVILLELVPISMVAVECVSVPIEKSRFGEFDGDDLWNQENN